MCCCHQAVNFVNHYLGFDGWANSIEAIEVDITGKLATAEAALKLADGRSLREHATQPLASASPEDIKFAQKAASTNALRRCLGRLVVVRAPGVTDVILLSELPEGAENPMANEVVPTSEAGPL